MRMMLWQIAWSIVFITIILELTNRIFGFVIDRLNKRREEK